MEITTRTYRNMRGQLVVETRIPLDGNRRLEIDTSKNSSGYVTTHAWVFHLKEDGAKVHALFQDYSKCFAKVKIRATEKALEAQHKTATDQIDAILADVERHYTNQPALLA